MTGELRGPTNSVSETEHTVSTSPWEQLLPICLFVGIVLVYLPAVRHDFIYDDRSMILAQEVPQSLKEFIDTVTAMSAGLPYFRPVSWGSLLFQKWVHGDAPAFFHLANAILMAAIAGVFYGLLRLPRLNVDPVPAALVAALFAVHPTSSSTVYPAASGRETLMPALSIVLSMYCFLRGGRIWFCIGLFAFAVALFSKEVAVITPLLLLLADLLRLTPDSTKLSKVQWVLRYTSVALVMAAYWVVRWSLFRGSEFEPAVLKEPMLPLMSLAYAVQTICFPPIQLNYEPSANTWFSFSQLIPACAVILALVAATWKCRGEIGDRSLFWGGWFLLALLPTANILKQEVRFDERYLFVALPAVLALIATNISSRWENSQVKLSTCIIGGILIVSALTVTLYRGTFFRNEIAFYTQWTRTEPLAVLPLHNLGNAWLERGRIASAVASMQAAIQVDPNFIQSHYDLGIIHQRNGNHSQAIECFEDVLEIDPNHLASHINLGELHLINRHYEAAAIHLKKTLQLDPTIAIAHFQLASCLLNEGQKQLAMIELLKALELVPEGSQAEDEIMQQIQQIREQRSVPKANTPTPVP